MIDEPRTRDESTRDRGSAAQCNKEGKCREDRRWMLQALHRRPLQRGNFGREGSVKRRTECGGSPFRAGISPYSAKLQRGSDNRTARAVVPAEAELNAILCSDFALSPQATGEDR